MVDSTGRTLDKYVLIRDFYRKQKLFQGLLCIGS